MSTTKAITDPGNPDHTRLRCADGFFTTTIHEMDVKPGSVCAS
jgi:hypothetical protein